MHLRVKPPKDSDLRAAALGENLDRLADHIYNGNLDDRAKLRAALGDAVEEALKIGYDIGRDQRCDQSGYRPQRGDAPILWRVVDHRLGAVDAMLLGDQPTDSYRIGLTVVNGPDGPDIEARMVYPCGVCGWGFSCGPSGEDCHS